MLTLDELHKLFMHFTNSEMNALRADTIFAYILKTHILMEILKVAQ